MFTLDDYNSRILTPSVLKGIKAGNFDAALLKDAEDIFDVVGRDSDVGNAMQERIGLLQNKRDLLLQCRCGWKGRESELSRPGGFKLCPRCDAPFTAMAGTI